MCGAYVFSGHRSSFPGKNMEPVMGGDFELWNVINEIRDRVTRIDSSLMERCADREKRIGMLETAVKKKAENSDVVTIEGRVRVVENRLWFAVGASSVLSSVGTIVMACLLRKWIG
jgi:hypothetical protein